MGIFDDDDLEFIEQARKEANEFSPLELTEANVQAVFHRCLAEVEDRKTTVWATLFPPELGYEYDPEEGVFLIQLPCCKTGRTLYTCTDS